MHFLVCVVWLVQYTPSGWDAYWDAFEGDDETIYVSFLLWRCVGNRRSEKEHHFLSTGPRIDVARSMMET